MDAEDLSRQKTMAIRRRSQPRSESRASSVSRTSFRQGISASSTERSSSTSTLYDMSVPQVLQDNGIYGPPLSTPPENIHEILDRIDHRRPSLSPTPSLKRTFDAFVSDNDDATNDSTVVSNIMPYITGRTPYKSAQDLRFSHLRPLTTADYPSLPPPNPSSYDGIDPSQLHPSVRAVCQDRIVPRPSAPILPNWFQETKGPDGRPRIIKTHAVHNGAAGARAMDTLLSHGRPHHPGWDRNAHAFGATFLDGTLILYSTHSEPQQAWGDGHSYHTHRLASESLHGSFEHFCRGVRRFRNLRELAAEEREKAVRDVRGLGGHYPGSSSSSRGGGGGNVSLLVGSGLQHQAPLRYQDTSVMSVGHRHMGQRRRGYRARSRVRADLERGKLENGRVYSSDDDIYQNTLEDGYENDDEAEDNGDDDDDDDRDDEEKEGW